MDEARNSNFLFSLKGKIIHNVDMAVLNALGYNTVYDFPYNHATTDTELMNVKSQIADADLVLVGGYAANSKTLLLGAIDTSAIVFAKTSSKTLAY